jgi:predicted RNase H-like nuclease (RuvC/YqgF family)
MEYVNDRTSALDSLVFGVDIQSGDIRGDSPSYAVVAFDGEHIDRDVVSHRKLRRLIDREEPAIIATDNMYELAADKDQLVRFLQSLPADTRLVQVTGAERPEPLSRVSRRHGVPYGKQPMEEAEAAARLAAANVGQSVSAFGDTTQLKVSRGRSTGKGGWSQDRYTRRIHGSVKRRTRTVEQQLREASLEFEKEVTEKYGGYANAIFTIEAPPSEIPVSSGRSGDTRIEIEQERYDGIEFEPLVKRRDPVVVGIDPGTTTAAAVVGLDGTVFECFSSRTADTAAVIEWIIERGRPIVIAADVTPIPETVEKFRRSFEAAGWTPTSDLPVDEKLHRTRDASYENDHERDALAAALFAVDAHTDQFERVTQKIPPVLNRGEVISRVVAGEESVEAVIRDLESDPETEETSAEENQPELSEEEKQIRRLQRRVDRLESHVDELNETIDKREETISDYEEKLSEAKREERRKARERREVKQLERENDRLERKLSSLQEEHTSLEDKLERLKQLWKLDHSNFADVDQGDDLVAVKVIEQFTTDAIRAADTAYGLASGDVIYLRDASGAGRSSAKRLVATDPRIILRSGGELSCEADTILFEEGIPVAPADEVTIQEVDELAVARETEIEAAIEDWEERAAERRRDRKASMVDQIISEHRAESQSGD